MELAEPLAYSTQESVRGCKGLGLLATMSEARHRSARITACFDIGKRDFHLERYAAFNTPSPANAARFWRSARNRPLAKDRMFLPRISSNDFGVSQVIKGPHVVGVERVEQRVRDLNVNCRQMKARPC
jgi:hypothetical protein